MNGQSGITEAASEIQHPVKGYETCQHSDV